MTAYEKIIGFLKENKVDFQEIEHEPVFTSEQANKVRSGSDSQGMKSLLLKGDGKYFLVVLPGIQRLDSRKAKDILGVKKFRFARPEEVVEIMGCEIGACYPFGNLINVPMYVDKFLSKNKAVSFNPGRHDRTINMKWKDYYMLVKPKLVGVSEKD